MDKLEAFKTENAANDAVVDDVAAKAYIENFALETFGRADEVQRRNKVTRQTADTFQAASTFLALLGIWGPLEPEMTAKIKFAKFHALRIAKAIKAGEDPNASNPVVEQPRVPAPTQDEIDVDQELQDLQRHNDAGVYQPPTVETAADIDESGTPLPTQSQAPPLPSPTPAEPTPIPPPEPADSAISPIDPADKTSSRAGSIGGGYFPSIPGATSNVNSVEPVNQGPPPVAPALSPSAADFYNTSYLPPASAPAPAPAPTRSDLGIASPDRPSAPTPHQMSARPPVAHPIAPSQPPIPTAPAPTYAAQPNGHFNTDDESILNAQKHAKWAISALNFEDVNTAVRELKIALHSLGAG